ncbi:unknown [Rickettsia prowazekii str. Madrid E]|uniref:HTH cro/C1-type domain-containing protein n=1 Tax=Rickettsia prowazekii (strain Madrid E) TaxID=272947 RepID=Q9ZCI3_RICPR|nr:Transcriptional regulator [Rickettsia prowazekii str. NMRC Madrid E]CAA15185.1 unknown [Rickettsia prowazekii str. Madrid E]
MSSMLKQIRLDAGKSLNQVSSDLKIRKKYLVALEEGDFDVLPGEVYVRGYLKIIFRLSQCERSQYSADRSNKTE